MKLNSITSFIRAAIDSLGDSGESWEGYVVGMEQHRLEPTIDGKIRVLAWKAPSSSDPFAPTDAEFEVTIRKVK
jgi:hypothetical protein